MPSPSLKVKQHSNSQNHASQFFAIFLFLSPLTATAAEGSPLQVAPPVITSAVSSNGTAGLFFSYQITATNSPSNFFATGLPPGLTINPITGLISGTPANSGSFSVNLIASNLGGNGSATLIARISAPAAEVDPMSYFIVASVSTGVSNNISPVITNSNIASARFFTVDYNHPSNFATFDDWMKNRMSSPLNGERVIAKPATYIQDQLSKPEQPRDILTINYS
jgi:hypothetical protein